MSDDSTIIIDYDDIKRAMKQEAQESSQSYSEQINTNRFNTNVRVDRFTSGQKSSRTSKLWRTRQDAYTVAAVAVACVVFVSVIIGAFYFLFSVWSDSGNSLGGIRGKDLFLYSEKKATEPLTEVLSEVAKDSVVQIKAAGAQIVKNGEKLALAFGVGTGTGTVVSTDSQGRLLILTNFHVVSNYYATQIGKEGIEELINSNINPKDCYLKVMTYYGDVVDTTNGQCELLAVHKSETTGQGVAEILAGQLRGTDLALIRTPPLPKVRPRFYISNRGNPKLGERFVTIGHPGGREFSPSEGTNQGLRDGRTDGSLRKHNVQADVFVYTIPTNPGSSGGPVFDSKGRIVGVHTLGFKDEQNFNAGYPADEILSVGNWDILVSDNVSELFGNVPRQ